MTISYSYYADSDPIGFEAHSEGCHLCRTSLYLVDNVTALMLEQEKLSDTKTIRIGVGTGTEGKAIIRTWTSDTTNTNQTLGPDSPFDVACKFCGIFWDFYNSIQT